MDVEADEEEEEEHPAPADSVVVAPTAADQAPSVEETEPFETDELLAVSSPPASPLSPWPSPPPQIPFPPLPPILSPPSPVLSPAPPPSPIRSLGYRAAMIRLRDEAASTSHSPSLQLPSASRREDRPEVTLPPRKRLDIALGPRYEVGESSKFYKTREDKEIDKVIVLENKIKDLDNIVYKTGQSVQTMNLINRNCKSLFAKPEFL
nr:hypothetical protein [Tanacetum cinerariifolium]